jgi:hypothetical protein
VELLELCEIIRRMTHHLPHDLHIDIGVTFIQHKKAHEFNTQ